MCGPSGRGASGSGRPSRAPPAAAAQAEPPSSAPRPAQAPGGRGPAVGPPRSAGPGRGRALRAWRPPPRARLPPPPPAPRGLCLEASSGPGFGKEGLCGERGPRGGAPPRKAGRRDARCSCNSTSNGPTARPSVTPKGPFSRGRSRSTGPAGCSSQGLVLSVQLCVVLGALGKVRGCIIPDRTKEH